MKDYSGLVATEIMALLGLVVFVSERGNKFFYSVLGQTQVGKNIDGTPAPTRQNYVYQFTPAGLILMAFLLTKTAKGPWGLAWVYLLAAMLLATTLAYYQDIIPKVVKKS